MTESKNCASLDAKKKSFLTPWLFYLIFLFFLGIDQWSKAWIRKYFHEGESPGYPWPGVFELTLTYNKGVAFGMLQGFGVLFIPMGILMAIMCAWYSLRHPKDPKLIHIALGLLASGAIGNLIDRAWLGKVTDMFWLRIINFPVFNVADSCITVSVALFILSGFFQSKSTEKKS